jgi:hypothetical protein
MNNNRVLPVSGSESIDEKTPSRTDTMPDEDTETKRKNALRKFAEENTFFKRLNGWIAMITIENFRRFSIWFLDLANIRLSLSFDDLMMILTFFVLFADDIRLLTAPKSVDGGFQVVNSICLFFFIFELLLTTWAKTRIPSWSPFVIKGYLFSFFFFLDVIAILSMLPDITWIAKGE